MRGEEHGPTWPNQKPTGQTWPSLAFSWAEHEPTWPNLGINLRCNFTAVQHRATWARWTQIRLNMRNVVLCGRAFAAEVGPRTGPAWGIRPFRGAQVEVGPKPIQMIQMDPRLKAMLLAALAPLIEPRKPKTL